MLLLYFLLSPSETPSRQAESLYVHVFYPLFHVFLLFVFVLQNYSDPSTNTIIVFYGLSVSCSTHLLSFIPITITCFILYRMNMWSFCQLFLFLDSYYMVPVLWFLLILVPKVMGFVSRVFHVLIPIVAVSFLGWFVIWLYVTAMIVFLWILYSQGCRTPQQHEGMTLLSIITDITRTEQIFFVFKYMKLIAIMSQILFPRSVWAEEQLPLGVSHPEPWVGGALPCCSRDVGCYF